MFSPSITCRLVTPLSCLSLQPLYCVWCHEDRHSLTLVVGSSHGPPRPFCNNTRLLLPDFSPATSPCQVFWLDTPSPCTPWFDTGLPILLHGFHMVSWRRLCPEGLGNLPRAVGNAGGCFRSPHCSANALQRSPKLTSVLLPAPLSWDLGAETPHLPAPGPPLQPDTASPACC